MREDEFKTEIVQISEISVLVEFGKVINEEINKRVRTFCNYLDNHPFKGFVEYVPAFTSISVIYNPLELNYESPYEEVKGLLEEMLCHVDFSKVYEENIVNIPVCYGEEFGPDIEYVAEINNLTIEEVIKIHSEGKYLVYMIGFAPGFPYLGGMSEQISAPRRESPRIAIPEGSVGIAGMQTGVYPIETPGGWQLIGRTPMKMFKLDRQPQSILKAGDIAKFYPISYDEYMKLKKEEY